MVISRSIKLFKQRDVIVTSINRIKVSLIKVIIIFSSLR